MIIWRLPGFRRAIKGGSHSLQAREGALRHRGFYATENKHAVLTLRMFRRVT